MEGIVFVFRMFTFYTGCLILIFENDTPLLDDQKRRPKRSLNILLNAILKSEYEERSN